MGDAVETEATSEPDRECTKCRATKPAVEFHRRGRLGRMPYCAACRSATRASRPRASRPPEAPHVRRRRQLARRYGITLEQYELMLEHQGSRCAICGLPHEESRPLAVDHCHATGRVRGLLCTGCNVALGYFEGFRRQGETFLAKYGGGHPVMNYPADSTPDRGRGSATSA